MDKFDRIYAFHKLLAHARRPIPRKTIEETLECSRSTFMRLVDIMRDHLGAPLSHGPDGWFYDRNGEHPYELPGLWFSAQELYALLAIDKMLSDLQPGLLDKQLRPFHKRIEQLLRSKQLGNGEVEDRIRILSIGVRRSRPARGAWIETRDPLRYIFSPASRPALGSRIETNILSTKYCVVSSGCYRAMETIPKG